MTYGIYEIPKLTYGWAEDKLDGKHSVKLANNTRLVRFPQGVWHLGKVSETGDVFGVVLHNTTILAVDNRGLITVNTGGWQTVTTKQRINQMLPDNARIFQDDFVWYWADGVPFSEGDQVHESGTWLVVKEVA